MLQDAKSYLGRCFAMKDLGEAAYIIGIKIYRDKSYRLIGLCQSAYIEKILKLFHMKNSKRGSIPMQEKLRLSKSQGASTPAELKRKQNILYASAVDSIMHAVRCTPPDIVFAQNITSQFQQNPGDLHWTTVKNILKYLKNTKDMFLVYRGYLIPKVSTQFSDLLSSRGPALERINGRLTTIGFVSALAVELTNGQDWFTQVSNGGIIVYVGTSVVLTLASLVPLFKGVRAESKSNGLMTSDAELWNGRFAMLGLVGLAFTEFVQDTPVV
ncbi:hypothetical protein Tco_1122355 [Tanacetum coccineum]|uniref:Uncharacterized protein n=1 Tax=Tanacetum coccineum TaxID=301880 RepID=A0ABQ5J0D2_9ASTR